MKDPRPVVRWSHAWWIGPVTDHLLDDNDPATLDNDDAPADDATADDRTADLSHPAAPAEEPLGSPWADLRAYVATPRLTGLSLSPDGSHLVASVAGLNAAKNAYVTSLWRVDPAGRTPARRLTRGVDGEAASAFLRDGSLLFTAKRTVPAEGDDVKETTKALWCLPADGGEAYVIARRDGGWEGVVAARAADALVLAVPAHPGTADEAADAAKREARAKGKVTAILHAGVPVRFWDHDLGAERTRLLAASVADREGDATLVDVRPLSGDVGAALAGPYSLSDDGRVLASGWNLVQKRGFVRDTVAVWDVAAGTRLIVEPDGDVELSGPVVSRDGRLIAAVAATLPTPERAPEVWLCVLDAATGARRDLTRGWDRWPAVAGWSPDGATIYVTADDDGDCPVWAVDAASGAVRRLTDAGAHSAVQVGADGVLYALRSSYTDPGSIVRIDPAGGVTPLPSPVAYPDLPGRLERVATTAGDGVRVPGYLLLPEGAGPNAPAKLALWIHGGPLGSWNAWSWRWCPWLLVAQGYAVLLPDPALSTGYGQAYIQRGWGRWGAESYTDLMALTDAVVARPDVDETRTAAMGGSYGGYMANWVAGHTDRFKAIVTHASLWNLETFGSTTDAPWYWDVEMSPAMRTANSPHLHAGNIATPMLVVHGDKDYRVPIGEGLALWWALVSGFDGPPEELPHRFLYFPDENHWVLTPNHARVWYETVLAFLARHVDGAPERRPDLV